MTPPRRTCLSVPGSSARMLARARTTPADEIVLDLEDAVAPGDKDSARANVVAAVSEPGWAARRVAVRVNAPGTPWCHHDLIALGAVAPDSVVVPKVESAGELAFVDRLLAGVEAEHGVDSPVSVQALIESPAGLQAVSEIAAATPRLSSLILGYADLGASLGRSDAAPFESWAPAQHAVLVAARAAGVHAIDGPWLGTAVDEPFLAAARHAAALGYDGKWAIHPAQLEALRECFTPSAAEVEWARRVLEALAGADRGAVALDGRMLDEAVAVAARRVLARSGSA